jgi:hypothetical protein
MQSLYKKNGVQEPSFGPFQLYKGGGLGNEFQRRTGLDPALAQNGPAGVDFALDHAAKNGWGAWYGAGKAGIGNMEGIGGADSASAALEKLAGSATGAGKGLGSLSQTLSSSFFPSAPQAGGGGGFGGLLSGLFGGGSGALSAAQIAKYTPMVGLFADGGTVRGPGTGTSDSIPTMLSNEEFVVNSRQSKKHRALLHAINNGTIGHMATGGVVGAPNAPRLSSRSANSGRGNEPGVLQVQIVGANGDDHVRMLVKQGVGEGLNQYNENQRRGGFGQTQNRFTAQKG